ncbi:MAG: alpha-amylase [Marinilabiliales bacterium]|nr:MAG: alpha-amylase [Marinilabiliales bacterium]
MINMNKNLFSLLVLSIAIMMVSCGQQAEKNENNTKDKMTITSHYDWSRNANIYEVNIRQYTEEGTFDAFTKHLPRLKKMGVDILWIMPIHPVGELNRKGSLGSYYAVKDYKAVNPEFGNLEDFKEMVNEAHKLGMKVIIDWVANHSAWDNIWVEEHIDYYEKDSSGKFVSPFDWTDVISFDYNNPDMRAAMKDALNYWLKETDIDGYRCDVAGMVPVDFWEDARAEMEQIKPVFMLAEDEDNTALMQKAFDMNYAWKLHHLLNGIYKGEKKAKDLWDYILWSGTTFPEDMYRMNFITNHDENSWNGTIEERMGDGAEAFAVIAWTVPGMPLIYSGQEAGLDKRLEFFEKDTINWSDIKYADFYTKLNSLKKVNKALLSGNAGGMMLQISPNQNENIAAYSREKDGNQVVVIANLSAEPQEFTIEGDLVNGEFNNYFTNESANLNSGTKFDLKPWEYFVFVK